MNQPGPGGLSPQERVVAEALLRSGRLAQGEIAHALAAGRGREYRGSALLGALIAWGKLSTANADAFFARLGGQAPDPGTVKMPPNSVLPLPGGAPAPAGGDDERPTRRQDSQALKRYIEEDDDEGDRTVSLPPAPLPGPNPYGPGGSGVFGAGGSGAYFAPPGSGAHALPSSGAHARPGSGAHTPAGSYAASGSGIFAHPGGDTPGSGMFGGTPGGDTPGSGMFGGTPGGSSGSFGSSPGGDTPGGFGSTPSGSFGASPSGTFGANPSGSFGAGPGALDFAGTHAGTGTFGASSGGSGSSSMGSQDEAPLDAAALGLAGERYEVERRPAPGQWEARDRFLGRRVVLRVDEEDLGDEFWRQARVLGRLEHAGLRQVHDVGVVKGKTFYSLDPLEGESLDRLLTGPVADRPTLPSLLRAFLNACAVIQHANSEGIAHGRLHPSQVRLGSFGQVWVTGWEQALVVPSAASEVKQALGAAPPLDPGNQALAPELREGHQPTVLVDVYGLGLVLHWILGLRLPGAGGSNLRGGDGPAPLRAIAEKALAADPDDRYYSVRALQEDVRRFIDGRAVLAVSEGPLRAGLRLLRRYPLAAGVIGVLGGLILAGSLVTLGMVRRRAGTAMARQQEAQLAREEAQGARERALSRARQARAQAKRAELVREAGGAIRRALSQGGVGAFAEAERVIEGEGSARPEERALRDGLRAQLYLARGRRLLYDPVQPRPDLALADFTRLTELRPKDPDAWLLLFMAARRLPGRGALERERAAIQRLGEIGGPWETLAQIGGELPELEQAARRKSYLRPPRVHRYEHVKQRLEQLTRIAEVLPHVAQVRTLRGRLGIVATGPGVGRRAKLLDDQGNEISGGRGIKAIWRDLYWAILLDPSDPEPYAAYIPSFFRKWGTHAPSRHKGGWPLGALREICRTSLRPEPPLALATVLQGMARYASTIPLLENALARPLPGAPRQPEAHLHDRLRLALARARLAHGQDPRTDFDGLQLPEDYAPLAKLLDAWQRALGGDFSGAARSLQDSLRWTQGDGSLAEQQVFLNDLLRFVTDRRISSRPFLQVLGPMAGPPQAVAGNLFAGILHLGIAVHLEAAGADPRQELQVLNQAKRALHWAPGGYKDGLLTLTGARVFLRQQPQHPGPHFDALRVIALVSLSEGSGNEALCGPAQEILVERLRKLGVQQAARAFSAVEDPVRELSVPRIYTAHEIWDWQGLSEERAR